MEQISEIEELPKIKHKNGFVYELVKRSNKTAMYSQRDLKGVDLSISYEVFIIKTSKSCTLVDKNNPEKIYDYPPSEKFPGNEDFGKFAWAYMTKEKAEEAFDKIENFTEQSFS
jgi:hypothetical protein